MIKNIVLDIGNVLIPFSWRQHLDHFGFSDEIKKRLADAVFLNDDWNEIDRGVLTKEELLARFIENDPGIEKEIYMVMENINGTVGEYPYTSTWVPKLKSMGYRVYLLSNFSDQQLHDRYLRSLASVCGLQETYTMRFGFKTATPVDMFPWTKAEHVETVCLLEKGKK